MTLNDLLSCDLMLQMLKPMVTREIQSPISTPSVASNTLNMIMGTIRLMHDDGSRRSARREKIVGVRTISGDPCVSIAIRQENIHDG